MSLKNLEKRHRNFYYKEYATCNESFAFLKKELKKAFTEILPKEKYCEHCDDRSVEIIKENINKYLNE